MHPSGLLHLHQTQILQRREQAGEREREIQCLRFCFSPATEKLDNRSTVSWGEQMDTTGTGFLHLLKPNRCYYWSFSETFAGTANNLSNVSQDKLTLRNFIFVLIWKCGAPVQNTWSLAGPPLVKTLWSMVVVASCCRDAFQQQRMGMGEWEGSHDWRKDGRRQIPGNLRRKPARVLKPGADVHLPEELQRWAFCQS